MIKQLARSILKNWSDQRRLKLFNESKAKIKKDLSQKLKTIGKTNDLSDQIDQAQTQQTMDLLRKKTDANQVSCANSLNTIKK